MTIRSSMGIAERKSPSDNAVFTNMSAQIILHNAISAANRLGKPVDPAWPEIAAKLVIPKREKVVISHSAFRVDEEKGATPDPLMGVFPLGFDLDRETEQATLKFYLKLAKRYIGSPMLSALYGVWAARAGYRELSLDLLERGYGDFCTGRIHADARIPQGHISRSTAGWTVLCKPRRLLAGADARFSKNSAWTARSPGMVHRRGRAPRRLAFDRNRPFMDTGETVAPFGYPWGVSSKARAPLSTLVRAIHGEMFYLSRLKSVVVSTFLILR